MVTLELEPDATARQVAEARELFAAVHKAATTARRGQWLHRDTADTLDLLIGMAERGLRAVAGEDEDDGAGDFPP